jgi:mannose-1-phosphate guanylyltransferase/mannose-6-phosphate isomerase
MVDSTSNVFGILLAGGTGTRLWPVSREMYPKQLVKFIGNDSLVQSTIKRLDPLLDLENVRVVCGEQHYHEIARHINDIGLVADGKIIQEPSGRNTAPAILLAAFHIHHAAADGIMCIFPADHVIGNIESFHERLSVAIELADQGHIVTFGIKPNYPETGYGYIEGDAGESDKALRVKRFVEKPDRPTAEQYIEAGNFFWNSGMFAFKASVLLEEFKKYQPEMLAAMEACFSVDQPLDRTDYDRMENISIDYAIMEKTEKCVVVPSDFGWSDIGSWKSLYDFLDKDADHNVLDGDIIARDTRNCFIQSRDRLIATNRLRDIVVVETPDSIFVSDLEHSRDVKSIVTELKDSGRKEYQQHRTVHHPWGVSKLLEQKDNYSAAELKVYPNKGLQLPQAADRRLHLFVIKGEAKVKTASGKKDLCSGDSFTWQAKGHVSIENTGREALFVLQVQTSLQPAIKPPESV